VGSTYGPTAVNLGTTWGQPGFNLGSTWVRHGGNLGQLAPPYRREVSVGGALERVSDAHERRRTKQQHCLHVHDLGGACVLEFCKSDEKDAEKDMHEFIDTERAAVSV